ncbi:GNAT family N-acetyltransferase [Staphylococcus cornubiensis]|uniref:GNAT family N-acetyltransferase n=1 Tax=Staphylococcus cornubiensis TaxID=1986155 RepID=UPI000A388CC3|nr:GNAT family N-acetyltransferase [Staphylococcus cornubiensis]
MKIEIETKNLYLMKPSYKYLNDLYKIHSDSRTNLHNPNGPHTNLKQTKIMLDSWIEHWNEYGFGYFLVLTKNFTLVGVCGVRYKKINNNKYLNLYYRISPDFMRRGYTKEACRAIINYVECNKINKNIKILARTKRENKPSIKTALSLGFCYDSSFDNLENDNDRYFFY